jgi:hypothetical protein
MTWLRDQLAEPDLITSFVYLFETLALDMNSVRCPYQESAHGCCRSNADRIILSRVPGIYALSLSKLHHYYAPNSRVLVVSPMQSIVDFVGWEMKSHRLLGTGEMPTRPNHNPTEYQLETSRKPEV